MVLLGVDSEIEMEGVGSESGCDLFGPLDSQAPRRNEKVFEEQILDLARVLETVGVEMHERAPGTAVDVVDREGGARDGFVDTETARETLDEGRLPDTEIPVKREGRVGWKHTGERLRDRARFIGAGGGNAGAELVEDRHAQGGEKSAEMFVAVEMGEIESVGGEAAGGDEVADTGKPRAREGVNPSAFEGAGIGVGRERENQFVILAVA